MDFSRCDNLSPNWLPSTRTLGFFLLSTIAVNRIRSDKGGTKQVNKYWGLLALAGLCEVGWAAGLKHANTAAEWLLTAAAIALSFWGLLAASNKLPVGTVYAVFTGIGAAGTVLAESLFFGLPFSAAKLGFIALLIAGIAGLKRTAKPGAAARANKEV